MAGDKVLVTGASGFVGSAVAHALIRSGYRVRALLRPTSKRTNLAGLDLEIVEGDMRDAASVARAMAGARFLFHVAAVPPDSDCRARWFIPLRSGRKPWHV